MNFDNPIFSAGTGLMGVGAALALLRRSLVYVEIFVHRKFITSLEINSRDPAYNWILTWLNQHTNRSTQHLSVKTDYQSALSQTNPNLERSIQCRLDDIKFNLVPSPGIHYFKYQGYWIKAERNREKNAINLDQTMPFETVTLTTIAQSTRLFNNLLKESDIASYIKR